MPTSLLSNDPLDSVGRFRVERVSGSRGSFNTTHFPLVYLALEGVGHRRKHVAGKKHILQTDRVQRESQLEGIIRITCLEDVRGAARKHTDERIYADAVERRQRNVTRGDDLIRWMVPPQEPAFHLGRRAKGIPPVSGHFVHADPYAVAAHQCAFRQVQLFQQADRLFIL